MFYFLLFLLNYQTRKNIVFLEENYESESLLYSGHYPGECLKIL